MNAMNYETTEATRNGLPDKVARALVTLGLTSLRFGKALADTNSRFNNSNLTNPPTDFEIVDVNYQTKRLYQRSKLFTGIAVMQALEGKYTPDDPAKPEAIDAVEASDLLASFIQGGENDSSDARAERYQAIVGAILASNNPELLDMFNLEREA
ncbi:hypothetical protein KA531_02495 [Candidatus Saccharibacteria bacterium]|nr:hypothetical protein [Candidatus Saccharibacteria bacterium]